MQLQLHNETKTVRMVLGTQCEVHNADDVDKDIDDISRDDSRFLQEEHQKTYQTNESFEIGANTSRAPRNLLRETLNPKP